jgi:hypothetical protein
MMPIPEFIALFYSLLFKDSKTGTMSFAARAKPRLVWMDPNGHYSNNKH